MAAAARAARLEGMVSKPPKRTPLAEAMRHAQAGMVLIAPMLVLGAGGYVLDRRFDTAPWLLLSGLILGMAAGFVNFLRSVMRPPGGGNSGPGGEE